SLLTKRYTEESINFITKNKDNPFFLYLAHAMPGSTACPFSSSNFSGKSSNGPYGDAVEELDWSCGEINKTLKKLGIEEDTLVIWVSDNGAVHWEPPQGSNKPLKGWGYDTSEGAHRVPCIAYWPGKIPKGVVTDRLTTMMDILPTAAKLAGTNPPSDRIIDGHDICDVLHGKLELDSPYDKTGFFYYHMQQLQAVRAGQWKLYLPLKYKLRNLTGEIEGSDGSYLRLYDVRNDIGETEEVSEKHPDVVRRLSAIAEKARRDLGDWDCQGANQRLAGWVEHPTPRLVEIS
nr:sulfatase-like hydrolase/transferase [Victivallales bacterium]